MAGLDVTCEACGDDFKLDQVGVQATEELPGKTAEPPARRLLLLKNLLLILIGAGLVVGLSNLLKPWSPSHAPATRGVIVMDPPKKNIPEPAPRIPAAPLIPEALPDPAPGALPALQEATDPGLPPAVPPATVATAGPEISSPAAPELPEVAAVAPEPVPLPAGPATAPSPAAPAAPVFSSSDAASLRKNSLKTLEHFLQASTLEERLALSQNPDKVRQEMSSYFASHPPGPFPLQEITFLTEGQVPDSSRKFHLYNVLLKDGDAPIPMAVEETQDGYRVDWSAFIESYTHRLRAFFAAPTETPGRFRVMLRRAHYFGPPVPGQDKVRLAYTVEPPMRDETFHIWVDKDSLVYQEKLATGERSGWDAESYVIVELVWRGDEAQGRWVALHRITADSWRAD